eukprot:350173-Chlamydomonas_euryale.AAC.5
MSETKTVRRSANSRDRRGGSAPGGRGRRGCLAACTPYTRATRSARAKPSTQTLTLPQTDLLS